MKLNLIAGGAGLVMMAVAAVAGGQMRDKERAQAIQTFAITEADLPMMQACENTLDGKNIEFKSKVSEISGCGCVAREVNDRISSDEREFAAGIFPTMIVASVRGDKDGKAMQQVMDLVVQHRVTPQRMDAVTTAMVDAVSKCSGRDLYMSADQKAEIAADKAKRDENTRIALEKLVEGGHMTREEANRRLASL